MPKPQGIRSRASQPRSVAEDSEALLQTIAQTSPPAWIFPSLRSDVQRGRHPLLITSDTGKEKSAIIARSLPGPVIRIVAIQNVCLKPCMELLRELTEQAFAAGATRMEMLCNRDDPVGDLLQQSGFQCVAEICRLCFPIGFTPLPNANLAGSECSIHRASELAGFSWSELADLVRQTWIDSQDLSSLPLVQEADSQALIEGIVDLAGSDAFRCFSIARNNGKSAGCLAIQPICHTTSEEALSLEIQYLGVAPRFRKRGIAQRYCTMPSSRLIPRACHCGHSLIRRTIPHFSYTQN